MVERLAAKVISGDWGRFASMVRPESVMIHGVSIQWIVRKCLEAVDNAGGDLTTWHELTDWVSAKINKVTAASA